MRIIRTILLALLVLGLVACGDDDSAKLGDDNNGTPATDMSGDTPADSTDMGVTEDQGTDASVPVGDPIEAPNETWTWVDFPDAVCGNGESTGLGVNLSDASDDIFVFMNGGGSCWDAETCFVQQTAVNIETGFSGADFEALPYKNVGLFSRSIAINPFKDASFVFVPYCTGDLHNGDAVQTYMHDGVPREVHHKGAANTKAYLKRLKDTLPNTSRIWLTGASAGGYGAQYNLERFVDTFPDAEVHILNDSGPFLDVRDTPVADVGPIWNIEVPSDCADCATSNIAWANYLFNKYPDTRFGLLSFTQDTVISRYMEVDGATFQAALVELATTSYDGQDNAHYYVAAGEDHVLLGQLTTLNQNGVSLLNWIIAWANGTPMWDSVRPGN